MGSEKLLERAGERRFTARDISCFCYLMIFVAVPLYLPRDYTAVLDAKTFMVWLAVILTAGLTLCFFVRALWRSARRGTLRRDLANWARRFVSSFVLTDIAIAVFCVTALLSCLLSAEKADAFTGSKAWDVGGLLIAGITFLYYLNSRVDRPRRFPISALFIGSVFVMFLAFLSDLSLDPFGFTEGVDPLWLDNYTSTIGNVDVFGAYLCVVLPVIGILFTGAGNIVKRGIYGGVLFLGWLDLWLTHADGAWLGVGCCYLAVIWWCLRDARRTRRFSVCMIICGIAGIVAQIIAKVDPEIYLGEVAPALFRFQAPLLLLLLSVGLYTAFRLAIVKGKGRRIRGILRRVSRAWPYVVFALFLILLYLSIRHFGREFLNRRGLLWEIAVRAFLEGGIKEKLFGLGPGNIDLFAVDYRHLIVRYYDGIYDIENAHNEFLEYLATTGVIGAVAWMTIYVSVAVDFFKRFKKRARIHRSLVCAFFGLLGYFLQSLVNGPHPMMAAISFALLAVYRTCMGIRKGGAA